MSDWGWKPAVVLILMFHRISDTRDPGVLGCFKSFILQLRRTHTIVLPGDPLSPGSLSVCLTFDDAYYDFYRLAFPFFRAHGIKSVLAVPTNYIIDDTQTKPEERLRPFGDRLRAGEPYEGSWLCTWSELNELNRSGLVSVASHGHSHASLTGRADVDTEIVHSRELLETRLDSHVATFVYPFGHFNTAIHARAKSSYQYVMRIGSALNFSWGGSRRLLYRVDADPLWRDGGTLGRRRLIHYGLNWLKNRSRNR